MLFVCSQIEAYKVFRETFQAENKTQFLDLSKVPSSCLADEAESILNHHKQCCVFLGYLEPGWMLEATHQTRLRKLFRKFPVAFVCHFTDSLPFSWKNEIDTFYTETNRNKHGCTNSLNNGGPV
jgi:hypothetical protein